MSEWAQLQYSHLFSCMPKPFPRYSAKSSALGIALLNLIYFLISRFLKFRSGHVQVPRRPLRFYEPLERSYWRSALCFNEVCHWEPFFQNILPFIFRPIRDSDPVYASIQDIVGPLLESITHIHNHSIGFWRHRNEFIRMFLVFDLKSNFILQKQRDDAAVDLRWYATLKAVLEFPFLELFLSMKSMLKSVSVWPDTYYCCTLSGEAFLDIGPCWLTPAKWMLLAFAIVADSLCYGAWLPFWLPISHAECCNRDSFRDGDVWTG